MESLALLDRTGRFAWIDGHAPWDWSRESILGTPVWEWVVGDNLEPLRTALSRCLVLHEPQRLWAEVSVDGRLADVTLWLTPLGFKDIGVLLRSFRLPAHWKKLTGTERRVLHLAGDGIAPRLIAERMDVERSTIDTHRRNIMRKLRIDDAHQFQAFAVRQRRLWQTPRGSAFATDTA